MLMVQPGNEISAFTHSPVEGKVGIIHSHPMIYRVWAGYIPGALGIGFLDSTVYHYYLRIQAELSRFGISRIESYSGDGIGTQWSYSMNGFWILRVNTN